MHAAIYRAIYWRCVILRQETGPTTVHLDISTSQILHLLWHGKGCKCPIERCFIVRVIENLQKIYNTIIVLLYSQNSRAKSGSKKTHAINFGIFCYFSALWYSDISASNNFFFWTPPSNNSQYSTEMTPQLHAEHWELTGVCWPTRSYYRKGSATSKSKAIVKLNKIEKISGGLINWLKSKLQRK